MALAPPSAYSVYDIAMALTQLLPQQLTIPSSILSNILNLFLSGLSGWLVYPILTAVMMAIPILYNLFKDGVNAFFNAIKNFVYDFVINPLRALAQAILNRLLERLEGVLFITFTVPLTIAQIRKLMEKPSLKGLLLLLTKPLIGYTASKVFASFIRPMLKPVTIPPIPPPVLEVLPPLKEEPLPYYENIIIDDILTLETQPPLSALDTITAIDTLALETLPPLTFLEYIGLSDYLTLETIPPLALQDSITLEDTQTIDIFEPLSLTDSITVEDILIIGVY